MGYPQSWRCRYRNKSTPARRSGKIAGGFLVAGCFFKRTTCPACGSLSTLTTNRKVWGIEMKASILSFRAAVLMAIAGMLWGIVIWISHDHSTIPAHAHLNLLGW